MLFYLLLLCAVLTAGYWLIRLYKKIFLILVALPVLLSRVVFYSPHVPFKRILFLMKILWTILLMLLVALYFFSS